MKRKEELKYFHSFFIHHKNIHHNEDSLFSHNSIPLRLRQVPTTEASISSLFFGKELSLSLIMVAFNKVALLLSLLPGVTSQVCQNDPDFEYPSTVDPGNPLMSCKKIRNKEDRRQAMCTIKAVNDACPQSCGVCCVDDITYVFKLKGNQNIVDCDWITKNDKKIDIRRGKYCQPPLHNYNGRTVRDACPASCENCKSLITASPTESPTGLTGAPTVSKSPTKIPTKEPSVKPSEQPTRPPSPQPSPFPTLRPSSSPSDAPSKAPSDSPSTFPSTEPSDQPSLLPSSDPSSVPSGSPSDQPSLEPSTDPSSEPSGNPTSSIKPSTSPSASPIGPTPAPTTAAPTVPCEDDSSFTFELEYSGDDKACSYLTQHDNPSYDVIRLNKYCAKNYVKEGCCASCKGYPLVDLWRR